MSETQTVAAESSPAETEDVFRGETPSFDEFSRYRQTGELPDRFKPAEKEADAASAEPEEEPASEGEQPESDPDAEPEEQQEKPAQPKKLTAKGRIAHLESTIEELWQQDEPDTVKIAQLTATIEKIERGAGMKRKTEVAAVTEPQSQPQPKQQSKAPQTFEEWQNAFDADAWFAEFAKRNPEASYEKGNAAMFAVISSVQQQFVERDRAIQAQARELQAKVEEARERYDDFDEVRDDFLRNVITPKGEPLVPEPVFEKLNKSPYLADLIFAIGSDPAYLADFVKLAKADPDAARDKLAVTEYLIREELEKGEQPGRQKTPAKPQTTAPKPPSPVGGGSSRAFDVSDESLSAEEWARKRTADLNKRGMG